MDPIIPQPQGSQYQAQASEQKHFLNKKFIITFVILLLFGGSACVGIWWWQNQQVANEVAPTFTPRPSASAGPDVATGWKTILWHDPVNSIIGFHFDAPDSWTEDSNQSNSERRMTVVSCPSNTCDQMSLTIGVSPRVCYVPDSLPSTWTKTRVTIGGISGDKIVEPTGTAVLTNIGLQKGSDCYSFQLYTSNTNKQDADTIFDHMLETFAFTAAAPPTPPAEYNLFKDIDAWTLTYQDKSHINNDLQPLVCSDGRKGNTTNDYAFTMTSEGYNQDPSKGPGDIDTPYKKVIDVLNSNGWVECGVPKAQQDPSNKGYSQVFIKGSQLIGVYTHYSMGTGNSLWVSIQYTK